MNSKKIGRPKKHREDTPDLRATDTPDEKALAPIVRQMVLDTLRVDPLSDWPLAGIFGPVILGHISESDKEIAGKVFLHMLTNGTIAQTETFFQRLLELKRNAERLPHRNDIAYCAYCLFIHENGFEPTKARLKKYILTKPDIFKDMPQATDSKAWFRLWDESGLFALE